MLLLPNVSQNSTDDNGALKRRRYRQFLLKASGSKRTLVNPRPTQSSMLLQLYERAKVTTHANKELRRPVFTSLLSTLSYPTVV